MQEQEGAIGTGQGITIWKHLERRIHSSINQLRAVHLPDWPLAPCAQFCLIIPLLAAFSPSSFSSFFFFIDSLHKLHHPFILFYTVHVYNTFLFTINNHRILYVGKDP